MSSHWRGTWALSASSTSSVAVATIEFQVTAACFLSTVSIVPYQAFWAHGAPCFAPCRIAVSFHRPVDADADDEDDGDIDGQYYRTPEYLVANEMTLQRVVLPKLVWVTPHCRVRLHLLDRYTAVDVDAALPKVFQPSGRATTDALGGCKPLDSVSGSASATARDHGQRFFFCCLSFVSGAGLVPTPNAAAFATRCPSGRRWWRPSL
ncbi:hypothetical protein PINS_up003162 [Pythium insidiosum]|nr:hypothetical protein PINS_up003162 [Pythium insidiosum]